MSQLPVLTAELCPDFHTQREDAGFVVITLVAAAKHNAVARHSSVKLYRMEVRERRRDAKKRYKHIKTVAKQKHLAYTEPELLRTCLRDNTLGTEQYGDAGVQRLSNGFSTVAHCCSCMYSCSHVCVVAMCMLYVRCGASSLRRRADAHHIYILKYLDSHC
jgi:hypothetical protein